MSSTDDLAEEQESKESTESTEKKGQTEKTESTESSELPVNIEDGLTDEELEGKTTSKPESTAKKETPLVVVTTPPVAVAVPAAPTQDEVKKAIELAKSTDLIQKMESGIGQQIQNYLQGMGDRAFNEPANLEDQILTILTAYIFVNGATDMGELKGPGGVPLTDNKLAEQASNLRMDMAMFRSAAEEIRKLGPLTRMYTSYLADIEDRYRIPYRKRGKLPFIREALLVSASKILPTVIAHITTAQGITGRDQMSAMDFAGGHRESGFHKWGENR